MIPASAISHKTLHFVKGYICLDNSTIATILNVSDLIITTHDSEILTNGEIRELQQIYLYNTPSSFAGVAFLKPPRTVKQ
jgi:hypothetical protein